LRQRNEWKFFGALPAADRRLATVWWIAVMLRGVLPAVFAIGMGSLVGAVSAEASFGDRWRGWAACLSCCRC